MRRSLIRCNVFDACFLINLDSRSDRLTHSMQQIERAKLHRCFKPNVRVERVSGVDGASLDMSQLHREGVLSQQGFERLQLPLEDKLFGMDLTPGAVGCALSHRLVWQRVVDANASAALILEDDVEFHHRFSREILQRWRHVPDDWGIVYLGGLDLLAAGKPPRPLVSKGFRRAYHGQRELTAYVVHAASAKRCLELSLPLTWQVDTHICSKLADDSAAQDKYICDPNSYALHPTLAIQVTCFGTNVQKKCSDNPALEDASRRMREFIGGGTSVR